MKENLEDGTQRPNSAFTLHILVVDDNGEFRKFLKDSLQLHYHVSEAADGLSGLTKAKEELPDLIISDCKDA